MLHCNNARRSLLSGAKRAARNPQMPPSLPVVLVPGLDCSARLYAPQIPVLWRFGPVTVVGHTRDDSMPAIAQRILADAPPRFALAGLSMGGYIALEIVRQAAKRVVKLALLDTGARADTAEASEKRRASIAAVEGGRFDEVIDVQFPIYVHPSRANDAILKAEYVAMCDDVGPEAYVRQQKVIMARADSRPLLPSIRCPTPALVRQEDAATPGGPAHGMA